jgi:hypothetical protein
MKRIALVLLLLAACGKDESASVDLLKQVASEVKTKPHVQVSVKMAGDQPTPGDEALLKKLETRIDDAHIGRLVSSGFEPGYMKVRVEVENTADAITKLRAILLDEGLLKTAAFRVIEPPRS